MCLILISHPGWVDLQARSIVEQALLLSGIVCVVIGAVKAIALDGHTQYQGCFKHMHVILIFSDLLRGMLTVVPCRSRFAFLCYWSLLSILPFHDESISSTSTAEEGRDKEDCQRKYPKQHLQQLVLWHTSSMWRWNAKQHLNLATWCTLPFIVFTKYEGQPLITVLNRINLQMCVHVFLVEIWTSKVIAIGIKFHRVVVIAHIWISSFTDCSFPIPVGPVSQSILSQGFDRRWPTYST